MGLMAMAALPPLNGFAGEWVIYQSFFKMSTGDLKPRCSSVPERCGSAPVIAISRSWAASVKKCR
ncbi:hypothetical protein C7D74_20740 [Klebsiella pneumoniae]|nr:hypothetical protein C7D74_20740 [Klebsiella pneumoniae]